MRLTFYGGSTMGIGANYLLEAGGLKVLIDVGLFQGSRFSEELNYEDFKYDAKTIDYVFITHSHIDHIGRLPKLYGSGFRGTVYATEPTKAIMEVALPDTLDKTALEGREMGHPPLFSQEDMEGVLNLTHAVKYREEIKLNETVTATFHDAGHILGSSLIEFVVQENGQNKRMLFTGDLGNQPVPILAPIDYVPDVDYLILESTYGDRLHPSKEECKQKLQSVIVDGVKRGGVIMIPSFAVERTQDLLFYIDELLHQNRMPRIPIFLDSPLAIHITKVYERFTDYFNPAAADFLRQHGGLFKFDWLTFTPTTDESKKINDVPPPKIIIAGSDMSQGGRIIHHERRYLSDPKSTILFIGYQVKGSLGRRILDKEPEVKILGEKVPVKCFIEAISGFSAHADQLGLVKMTHEATRGRGLKKVFAVQGEDYSARALAVKIKLDMGIEAIAPDSNQSFEL